MSGPEPARNVRTYEASAPTCTRRCACTAAQYLSLRGTSAYVRGQCAYVYETVRLRSHSICTILHENQLSLIILTFWLYSVVGVDLRPDIYYVTNYNKIL